jgi:hypothetical protein
MILNYRRSTRQCGRISLTELCWLVSEQWPINLELQGKPFDAAGIQEGIDLMWHIFRPYLILEREGSEREP